MKKIEQSKSGRIKVTDGILAQIEERSRQSEVKLNSLVKTEEDLENEMAALKSRLKRVKESIATINREAANRGKIRKDGTIEDFFKVMAETNYQEETYDTMEQEIDGLKIPAGLPLEFKISGEMGWHTVKNVREEYPLFNADFEPQKDRHTAELSEDEANDLLKGSMSSEERNTLKKALQNKGEFVLLEGKYYIRVVSLDDELEQEYQRTQSDDVE